MSAKMKTIRVIGLVSTNNLSGNGAVGLMQFTVWGGTNGIWDISAKTTDVKL